MVEDICLCDEVIKRSETGRSKGDIFRHLAKSTMFQGRSPEKLKKRFHALRNGGLRRALTEAYLIEQALVVRLGLIRNDEEQTFAAKANHLEEALKNMGPN
ncbi:hypothetical protein [uncultured Roseobacter sp.]|uniref:hypothetical protein n=1 Tax=uncultured Roseobacter sp. TaxID=114847 RepID=UPI0026024380|nr:hypothetical protein [uncultured Roseobacter sp.]